MLLRDDATRRVAPPPIEARKRPLDNPRVIAVAVVTAASRCWPAWSGCRSAPARARFVSPLLSDVLLYVLYAVDLTILAALLFVLVRNLLKLWVEQRRARPVRAGFAPSWWRRCSR